MINIQKTLKRLEERQSGIESAQFSQPLLMFHGTSSKYLKSILVNGLIPTAKEGRWVEEDGDASQTSRSRASYGGVYFTTNFGTATSAATNLIIHQDNGWQQRKSNVIVVCAEIQPASTVDDEDNYKFGLFAERIPESLYPSVLAFYRANRRYPNDSYSGRDYNKQTVDLFKTNVDALIERFAGKEHNARQDKSRLYPLAQEVLLTEMERQIAYKSILNGTKPYYSYDRDARNALNRIKQFKGIFTDGEPLPSKMRPQTTSKAEQRARSALDLFIKATKNYSKRELEQGRGSQYPRGSTRVLSPVLYSGSNKITCIVELRDKDIVLHYGAIPSELKRQYTMTKGPWPPVVNKAGKAVESSTINDAISIHKIGEIEETTNPFDGTKTHTHKYIVAVNNKPIKTCLTAIIDENDPKRGYFIVDGDEKHTLGTVGMRKVFKCIKRELPQLDQLYGNRITGARRRWNKKSGDWKTDLTKVYSGRIDILAAAKQPLIMVDIQPAYENYQSKSFKTSDMMQYLNIYPGPIMCLINAEDMSLTEDSKETIKQHYLENGLNKRTLNRLVMIDKGYGHLRPWMDGGISKQGILSVLRHMMVNNINDSRDLFEETPEKAKEFLNESDYNIFTTKSLAQDPLLLGWIEDKLLRKFKGAQVCGGGRSECLAEVLLLMDALKVPYTVLEKYVY